MKIYKRRVLEVIPIKCQSAFIDGEMLIRAKQAGFAIAQFPVKHYQRQSGLARGSQPEVIFTTIKEMILFRLGLL